MFYTYANVQHHLGIGNKPNEVTSPRPVCGTTAFHNPLSSKRTLSKPSKHVSILKEMNIKFNIETTVYYLWRFRYWVNTFRTASATQRIRTCGPILIRFIDNELVKNINHLIDHFYARMTRPFSRPNCGTIP